MKELSEQFNMALAEYLFLLERKYSQTSILKLVSDRHQLSGEERSMLLRGIHPKSYCVHRKSKSIKKLPVDCEIFIDGYNVIRTLGSYFLGKSLFISMDGFLRDASEMHRKTLPIEIRNRCLDLIINHLIIIQPKTVLIYLDSPISKSGELASIINKQIVETGLNGEAITVHSPDHHLKIVTKGIICTADSSIIDKGLVKVFDLAFAILTNNYQPDFIDFQLKKD